MDPAIFQWVAIVLCVGQSAIFSGLNLALFGVSRLELEIEVGQGNKRAERILALRRDSNFLLTTILWGNVATNVLLALVIDSAMTGLAGFLFSTVVITVCGEIMPQAFFSRFAMQMGSLLSPLLRAYQFLLFPVAKPTAWALDLMLGEEGIQYFQEVHLRDLIKRHMQAEEADLEQREGLGALNFLDLDDLPVSEEGEAVDPTSVLCFPCQVDLPVLPSIKPDEESQFVADVEASGKKWVILCNESEEPMLVLDSDALLRAVLRSKTDVIDPYPFCFRPLIIKDPQAPLGSCLKQLCVSAEHSEDDVIDHDIVLLWSDGYRRIVTGADILGRLLRGIVRSESAPQKQKLVP